MTIRERTEQLEEKILSPYASLAENSRGRFYPKEPCALRTAYQRDRDAVLHCKSFRRLKHKTQVFLAPEGDHYRTRLTHTLEVSQIARTIGRALRLNEDLIEAIALGHDLGHTPFGHAGERALNEVCPYGYKHYLQSVRVAQKIENNGKGLNLCWEVLNGIACHTKGRQAVTLEGQAVRAADRIAYINHDIDDAVRAGVLSEADLPYDSIYLLGRGKSARITTLIRAVVDNSVTEIKMDGETQKAFDILHSFMFEYVYTDPVAKSQEEKASDVVKKLYEYFLGNLTKLPLEYKMIAEQESAEKAVCDYISGMSDRYAISTFCQLYVPSGWDR